MLVFDCAALQLRKGISGLYILVLVPKGWVISMNKLLEIPISDVHTGYFLESVFCCDFVSFEYLNLFGGLFDGLCFVASEAGSPFLSFRYAMYNFTASGFIRSTLRFNVLSVHIADFMVAFFLPSATICCKVFIIGLL
jgi:hypothetical protein